LITVYNIRGTNGSGKSTLARSFIRGDVTAPPNRPGDPNSPLMVDLTTYPSPTKQDPGRRRFVEGYGNPGEQLDVLVVGSYRTACGGLDAVPNFETTFKALDRAIEIMRLQGKAPEQAIIAEGVLASTVWGSWGAYATKLRERCAPPNGHAQIAFCYLDTPLEVCLERIRARQKAAGKEREIKEELVRDKVKAVAATRTRALEAGHLVYDLPYQIADTALFAIIADVPKAREMYRARA
jgi:hypothetical protein